MMRNISAAKMLRQPTDDHTDNDDASPDNEGRDAQEWLEAARNRCHEYVNECPRGTSMSAAHMDSS